MDSLQLKNKIIQRITQIDDVNLLNSLDQLLNSSDINLSKLVSFLNDKFQNGERKEKEDFNDYIKEWVKSM